MWTSVSIETDAGRAEALSDALMAHGALSVAIEDADAGTEAETPQFGEPGEHPASLWAHSRVVALLPAEADVTDCLSAACAAIDLAPLPPHRSEPVEEQNWVRLTQAQFEPIRIDPRLWIVPSWHDAPDPTAINLLLDPGMAFGTGSHPTTRLCLRWLCAVVRGQETVLDYGCGSGILAIAAARLGAGCVHGVDIDPHALEAAADNARQNQVTLHLQHSGLPLTRSFDLVVANILTNPLCVLAPLIAARVAPGGRLALSGILDSQAGKVIEAYAPFIALTLRELDEGWVLLEGCRP